jgi:nitroimidazol reductase NimA-like FMN-containing flavoprotein (pyridoxamine 5'-phosphate oxidase superfamily)
MSTPDSIEQRLRRLFKDQGLAVLSTFGEGQPYASLVAFAAAPDLAKLLFCTSRATRKYANMQATPRAALLIDSRSNRDSDFHHAVAATATGAVREMSSAEAEEFGARFLSRHPYLDAFVRSPSCARMVLDVDTYILVSRFQNVMELHIKR